MNRRVLTKLVDGSHRVNSRLGSVQEVAFASGEWKGSLESNITRDKKNPTLRWGKTGMVSMARKNRGITLTTTHYSWYLASGQKFVAIRSFAVHFAAAPTASSIIAACAVHVSGSKLLFDRR